MQVAPLTDHCHTAADVLAAARRSAAFRMDIQRRPVLLAREQERRRAAEEAARLLAEANAKAAALAAEEARQDSVVIEVTPPTPPKIAIPKLTVSRVVKSGAKALGVSVSDIVSEKRLKALVEPRQIVAWCARKLTDRSLIKIGEGLGDRDHSTILHAINKVDEAVSLGTELGVLAIKTKAAIELMHAQEMGAVNAP